MWEEGMESEDGRSDPSRAEGSGRKGSSKDEGVNNGDKLQDHNLYLTTFHIRVIRY